MEWHLPNLWVITYVPISIFLQNKKILGATCSTNYAEEYNLLSKQQAGGKWRYACNCRGESDRFKTTGDKKCYLHYWECPLTT